MRNSKITGKETGFEAATYWPREFLSLGLAAKQAQKRPSGIAKSGDFSGVFDEFGRLLRGSGGEEWI
jgi:hypothetical protein